MFTGYLTRGSSSLTDGSFRLTRAAPKHLRTLYHATQERRDGQFGGLRKSENSWPFTIVLVNLGSLWGLLANMRSVQAAQTPGRATVARFHSSGRRRYLNLK